MIYKFVGGEDFLSSVEFSANHTDNTVRIECYEDETEAFSGFSFDLFEDDVDNLIEALKKLKAEVFTNKVNSK